MNKKRYLKLLKLKDLRYQSQAFKYTEMHQCNIIRQIHLFGCGLCNKHGLTKFKVKGEDKHNFDIDLNNNIGKITNTQRFASPLSKHENLQQTTEFRNTKSELKPIKMYEKSQNRPFRSVSEYFEILEKKTGVKFEHPSQASRKLESSLLLRNNRHQQKENVLLFKNTDEVEYTRADKLILWSKDVEVPGANANVEGFNGEIEGHNPHWKLYEQENLRKQRQQSDPNLQAYYLNFEEYDEIEKNLRLARNIVYLVQLKFQFIFYILLDKF